MSKTIDVQFPGLSLTLWSSDGGHGTVWVQPDANAAIGARYITYESGSHYTQTFELGGRVTAHVTLDRAQLERLVKQGQEALRAGEPEPVDAPTLCVDCNYPDGTHEDDCRADPDWEPTDEQMNSGLEPGEAQANHQRLWEIKHGA